MIIDLGEPVPGPGGNDHHIARLEVVGLAVLDLGAVVARAVEQAHGLRSRGTTLHVGDLRTEHERGAARHDVIHFADEIVLGN